MRERLGSYELISLMSVGGMAELYLAVATGQGGQFRKVVALKRLLPEARTDPDAVARFLDEAKLTVSLSHPAIAHVFELGEADGELYLAMEFILGVDLARLVAAGPLPAGFVLRVALDVAAALAYAFDELDVLTGQPRCVVHRDLTPRNVMVTFDGAVKVIDFGLAHFRGRVPRTAQGRVRGTAQYMAPEQLRGEKLDARTDLYALGVVMWELLCGRELRPGSREEVLERHAAGAHAPPVLSVAPNTPPPLARIVDTLLDARPAARVQSAKELQRALASCNLEVFDGERTAALVRTRLPGTHTVLQSVFAMAGDPATSEAALSARIKELRRADRARAESPELPPRPEPAPRRRSTFLWALAALPAALVVLVLAGRLGEELRPPQLPPQRSPEAMQAATQARQKLGDRDPLAALEILDGCRVRNLEPCTGLETEYANARRQLEESTCGTEEAARQRIAEAAAMTWEDERLHALRRCRAGRVLHPLAEQEIFRLTHHTTK